MKHILALGSTCIETSNELQFVGLSVPGVQSAGLGFKVEILSLPLG